MVVIFQGLSRNVMAGKKALYDGYAIATVAATSESIEEGAEAD